jgi:hypothetical protein
MDDGSRRRAGANRPVLLGDRCEDLPRGGRLRAHSGVVGGADRSWRGAREQRRRLPGSRTPRRGPVRGRAARRTGCRRLVRRRGRCVPRHRPTSPSAEWRFRRRAPPSEHSTTTSGRTGSWLGRADAPGVRVGETPFTRDLSGSAPVSASTFCSLLSFTRRSCPAIDVVYASERRRLPVELSPVARTAPATRSHGCICPLALSGAVRDGERSEERLSAASRGADTSALDNTSDEIASDAIRHTLVMSARSVMASLPCVTPSSCPAAHTCS